ncbi:unnamed protein product [Rotaria magnacalcarata]|uniref:Uncharacterized protein n=1 Tax=Rotaria magnacalcarata TaxID=392030 RepID=A0A816TW62_9BILA|nr:unnamed protein product [Rotaria magnacalcarata]CAF2107940.1 unnamed protein product [Rotaria magnacalcarata]CAF3831783.1 unnamed protein product [Rotaria magnacalcarata]CAF4207898.1 unnamed protein product [Rotaria magnacalcarata]
MALSQTHLCSAVNDTSVLFTACKQGDLQTIEARLDSVASSDIYSIRDENQATLIHYASRFGYLHILKYFLEVKHIDISQLYTEHGATCAHDAAVCNQWKLLKYIFDYYKSNLSQKFRWSVRDKEGNTTLHLAAYYDAIDVVHYLLEEEYADSHCRSYSGYQPIHYAAERGHTQSVQILLKKSPDLVNQQTNQLLTPLHLAAQIGSLGTIQILILYGANLQSKDQYGLTCLHFACQNNHINVVQWLIEKKDAKIDNTDYMQNTLLHYAAMGGNAYTINYLLDKRAKIVPNNDGNTPLHFAAKHGHQNACIVLIERGGCSLTAVNGEHLTAADLAANSGYIALANELRLDVNPATIQVEKATVVRLVIKKKNVARSDAGNQVNEQDLLNAEEHSSDKYAPWLKMTNQTTQEFQRELQNVQLNLRKTQKSHSVQESSPIKEDISTSTQLCNDLNNQDTNNESIPDSFAFVMSNVQSDISHRRRSLIQCRQDATNEA